MTNKLVVSLSSLARWKAFIRKYKSSLSNLEEEKVYIKSLFDYQKNWIKDGKGSPLAKVEFIDMWEAINTFQLTINELSSLDDVNDLALYYEACLALEYTE